MTLVWSPSQFTHATNVVSLYTHTHVCVSHPLSLSLPRCCWPVRGDFSFFFRGISVKRPSPPRQFCIMAAHSSLLHASFCVCWRQPKISSRCVPKNKRERDGCCVYLNPLYFPSSVLYWKSLVFPECIYGIYGIYLRNDDGEFILDDEVLFLFFPRPKRIVGDQQRRWISKYWCFFLFF